MSGSESADGLRSIAHSLFGLEVRSTLPVTESFSSTVLRFVATDGRHYVVKQPWLPHKAAREAAALRALASHPTVPRLLGHEVVGNDRNDAEAAYLLIEGLDGVPWTTVAGAGPSVLHALGQAMRAVHTVKADSFDGDATWHKLLVRNADRYQGAIGQVGADSADAALADKARAELQRHIGEIPSSEQAVLVHFDLRPGNILVNDNRLVGLIDFESCRGGHASMDFFKLWQQVVPVVPEALSAIVEGYLSADERPASWLQTEALDRLMRIYSLYHGLAGLAWCAVRDDFSGDFPDVNRQLIRTGIAGLAATT